MTETYYQKNRKKILQQLREKRKTLSPEIKKQKLEYQREYYKKNKYKYLLYICTFLLLESVIIIYLNLPVSNFILNSR